MEYMNIKNLESKKYVEKCTFASDELFVKLLLANGSDEKEVLDLIEKGIFLITEDVNKASVYFLAVSLLDNISQELSSFATDIMLYSEEKNNKNLPKEFSSVDDIKSKIVQYKKSDAK